MNKKEFLKTLEKRLSILDEQEVKDIINEYEDIIDEKVKDGKTEEEAVKEFGSIDELTTEILKAYKLNSKYTKEKEPVKEAVDNIEGGIKKLSRDLASFCKSINNGNGISIELIFELIIKFLILLIVLAVLRLPFTLISNIGEGILEIAYFPVNHILSTLWNVGIVALYFLASALIFVALFKQYVASDIKDKSASKTTTNQAKKQNVKVEPKNVEQKEVNKINESRFLNLISTICKIFMIFIFIIPLWCINFGLISALAVSIYYTIIGINIWGLIILFTGLILGCSWLISIFHSIIFKEKKISIVLLPISLLVTVIGGFAFCANVLTFDYMDTTRELELDYSTYTEEFVIEEDNISFVSVDEIKIQYDINNDLENNKFSIQISYPKEFMNVNDIEISNTSWAESKNRIHIASYDSKDFNIFKKIYNVIIEDLKNGKLYNYDVDSYLSISISANENTMNLIK